MPDANDVIVGTAQVSRGETGRGFLWHGQYGERTVAPKVSAPNSKGGWIMDRRDALKKMAATGVIVGGAAAITSSTAFADRGTPGSLPTTSGTVFFFAVNPSNTNQKILWINVADYTSSCPGGTPAPSANAGTLQISIDGGPFQSLFTGPPRPADSFAHVVTPGANNTAGVVYTLTIRSICGGAYTCDTFSVTMRTQPGGPIYGSNGAVSLNGGPYLNVQATTGPISSSGSSPFCDVNPPPVP